MTFSQVQKRKSSNWLEAVDIFKTELGLIVQQTDMWVLGNVDTSNFRFKSLSNYSEFPDWTVDRATGSA